MNYFATRPDPDVHDIPLAYRTFAAALLLGMFGSCEGKNPAFTLREVRAAGGIRGLYSYARLQQQEEEKKKWLRMA